VDSQVEADQLGRTRRTWS